MPPLSRSELILNPDGSIYHLKLLPGDIAPWIITVGDMDRVAQVSKHFDRIELKKGNREFLTHTGTLAGKRISVISTGIGTDNIDIVLGELDALHNIDFTTRRIRSNKTQLNFIRIGTAGSLQATMGVDGFVLAEAAVGLDGLLHFYRSKAYREVDLELAMAGQLGLGPREVHPYAVACDLELAARFPGQGVARGIGLTSPGFYGPQGRALRLAPEVIAVDKLASFDFKGQRLTHMEMETAGLYGLAKLLGHRAVSLSAILANRALGEFSRHPARTVEALILFALEAITSDRKV